MSASERLRRSLAASARDAADAPPPPAVSPHCAARSRRAASTTRVRGEGGPRGGPAPRRPRVAAGARAEAAHRAPRRHRSRRGREGGVREGAARDAQELPHLTRRDRRGIGGRLARGGPLRRVPGHVPPRVRVAALPRVSRLRAPAAAVPHVPRGLARAHRQGGARARRRRESKIQHRCPRLKRAADAPTR